MLEKLTNGKCFCFSKAKTLVFSINLRIIKDDRIHKSNKNISHKQSNTFSHTHTINLLCIQVIPTIHLYALLLDWHSETSDYFVVTVTTVKKQRCNNVQRNFMGYT